MTAEGNESKEPEPVRITAQPIISEGAIANARLQVL